MIGVAVACLIGSVRPADAQEIWKWDMVVRGTGGTPSPDRSSDVWVAPNFAQDPLIDGLSYPIDAAENPVTAELLIADTYNARLVRFDRATGAYKGPIGFGLLAKPYGIAVDAAGNIIVADWEASKVFVFDQDGNVLPFAFDVGAHRALNQPFSVAITPGASINDGVASGEILIFDSFSRIVTFGTDFQFRREFGSPGAVSISDPVHGQFDAPFDVAIRPVSGIDPTTGVPYTYPYQVYVADAGNNRIQVLTPNGTWLADLNGVTYPEGVTVDANGRVLVADTFNNRIAVYTAYPDFQPITLAIGFASRGTNYDQISCNPADPLFAVIPAVLGGGYDPNQCAPGILQGPTNIGLDSAGRLLVIDSSNARLERFDHPAMTATTLPVAATVTGGNPIVLKVAVASASLPYANVTPTTIATDCRDSNATVVNCAAILNGSPTIDPAPSLIAPGAPVTFTVTYQTLAGVVDQSVRFTVTVGNGTVSATALPSAPVSVGFTGTPLVTTVAFAPTVPASGWFVTDAPIITLAATGLPAATAIDWAFLGDGINAPEETAGVYSSCAGASCVVPAIADSSRYLWFRARNSLQTEAWHSQQVNFEVTPPQIDIATEPTPCPTCAGWLNTDAITKYNISNTVSGVLTITPVPLVVNGVTLYQISTSGEGANLLTPTLTVKDLAGLQTTAQFGPYKVDKTAPAISPVVAVSPGAAATTWYNVATGAPTVTFTATDALSGFSAAQSSTGVAGALNARVLIPMTEGSNQGATASATTFNDQAGNGAVVAAGATVFSTTAPAVAPPAGATITGNAGALTVAGLKVDVSLPTFSVAPPVDSLLGQPIGGSNGWLDLSGLAATVGVRLSVTASDAVSGIQQVCYDPLGGTTCTNVPLAGAVYPFTILTAGLTNGTIWVRDVAGNQTPTQPFALKINRNRPVVTAATLTRTATEDTPLTTNVAATDLDAGDNALLVFTLPATTTKAGTLTNINPATGAYTYTPAPNFNGAGANADTFTFTVTDGKSATPTSATVTISVTAVNDPPVAQDASLSTNEDTALPIPVSTSYVTDVDTALASVTLAIVTAPVHGTAIVSGGTITYTPAANYAGADSFTYRANDGSAANNLSNIATIAIDVVGVNDAPIANNGAAVTSEDAAVTVPIIGTPLVTDPDTAASGLTLMLVQPPANGTATVSGGSVAYTPNADFFGTDTFTYKVNDGQVDSNVATITVTVNPVNDAPSFVKGGDPSVNEDAAAQSVAWATALSAGPANESAQVLNFIVTNSNPALFSAQPTVAANGTLTYTPAANAYGVATVTVQAHDNGGTMNGGVDTSAPQTFTITVNAVNDAPSFVKGANQSVPVGSVPRTVSGWATAISAGPNEPSQTVVFLTTNSNNALFTVQPAVAPNGTLTFTPAAAASGTATVTVLLQDDGGTANGGIDTSAAQTFTITLSAGNQPPVATTDAVSTTIGVPILVDVLANDVDPEGDTLTLTSVTRRTAKGGYAVIVGGKVLYAPPLTLTRGNTDTFTYTISDGKGGTATGVVTVTIINKAPTAKDDAASTFKGKPVVVAVLANDWDADRDTLSIASTTPPAHGAIVVNPNGTIKYTPVAGYAGTDAFTYTVSDGNGGTATATVTITIRTHFKGDDCGHEAHSGGHRDGDDDDHERDTRGRRGREGERERDGDRERDGSGDRDR